MRVRLKKSRFLNQWMSNSYCLRSIVQYQIRKKRFHGSTVRFLVTRRLFSRWLRKDKIEGTTFSNNIFTLYAHFTIELFDNTLDNGKTQTISFHP